MSGRIAPSTLTVAFGGGSGTQSGDWAVVSVTTRWDSGVCGRTGDRGGEVIAELKSVHGPEVYGDKNPLVGSRMTVEVSGSGQTEPITIGVGIVSSIRARPVGPVWLYTVTAVDAVAYANATQIDLPALPQERPDLRLKRIRQACLEQCDWDLTGAPPVMWSAWGLAEVPKPERVGLLSTLQALAAPSGHVVRTGSGFRIRIAQNWTDVTFFSGGVRIARGALGMVRLSPSAVAWPEEWIMDREGTLNAASLGFINDSVADQHRADKRVWRLPTTRQDATWAVETSARAADAAEAEGMPIARVLKGSVDALTGSALWRPAGPIRVIVDRVAPGDIRRLIQPRSRTAIILDTPNRVNTLWRVTSGQLTITRDKVALSLSVVQSELSGVRRMVLSELERPTNWGSKRKWSDLEGAGIKFADLTVVGWAG